MTTVTTGGIQTFCDRHWQEVLKATLTPIAATLMLTDRAMGKVIETCGDLSSEAMATELRAHEPLCCFLGDAVVADVITMSQSVSSGVEA